MIHLGRGPGTLNELDPGRTITIATRLTGSAAAAMRQESHNRRLTVVLALLALTGRRPLAEVARTALAAALLELADRHTPDRPPTCTTSLAS